ncbi:hypothetical protein EYZ11_003159 [Aspergillus tanneri]|nr:hypothetical protein EYZ11_003159 [Aspergillus tanneri]
MPSSVHTAHWMKRYPDSTPVVRMNLPGTHDSATWNYSQATQDALRPITDLNGESLQVSDWYRCQDRSLIDMLNAGIRVFDLRFAMDATSSTLVFYHGAALQSETATVEDVFFGFYHWLDHHPTEALFLSLKYEDGTARNATNDISVQRAMYKILTSMPARHYLNPMQNELGTLGQARGKITLFRRFDMADLPTEEVAHVPGLHFPPRLWTDNSPNIELLYNKRKNFTAFIGDFYETGAGLGSSAALNIQWKLNATTSHLVKAATQHPDSLFWTFASSEYDTNVPPDYPRIMALGNGTQKTPQGGANHQLISFMQQHKGQRLGIVMFDFFDQPADLVATLLDL